MKVINRSKNTVYAEDIDLYIPYNEQIQEIDPDTLKKSRCLRNFILNDMLEVIEYDQDERIESSLMYFKNQSHPQCRQNRRDF